VLGTLDPSWVRRTGLAADVKVHCGLHDSNAALLAARAFPEIAEQESTVLSTGTWFVAMRSPGSLEKVDVASLPEDRDCLVNVDAFGKPIPSARFMGGREIETLTALDAGIDETDEAALLEAVPEVLTAGTLVLPTFAPGFGPFPLCRGQWINRPGDAAVRRAAVSLYAALVADVSLDLIGSRERILVEGRFARDRLFIRALAALRPASRVYAADAQNDASFGALRLLIPDLEPRSALREVTPIEGDIGGYRERWRSAIANLEQAA
jgi:sugar (pentulose or hexulose) kinase